MPTERTIDLLANSFDLNVRRKFTLNNKDGQKIIDLYFKPITRSDRKVVNKAAGTEEALAISTQMLCHKAELENGTKAFQPADAVRLQRELPDTVLNDLELFLFNVSEDPIEDAKES